MRHFGPTSTLAVALFFFQSHIAMPRPHFPPMRLRRPQWSSANSMVQSR